MSQPNPDRPIQSKEVPASPSSSQRCLLYLFGELDRADTAAFEKQLESSPELGDELIYNANLITTLSKLDFPAAAVSSSYPQAMGTYSWRWVASILAIAASLAIFFLVAAFYGAKDLTDSEDLLIARAWASSRVDESFVDWEDPQSDNDEAVMDSLVDESPDVDSVLSWMVFAVSTDLNPVQTESKHEG